MTTVLVTGGQGQLASCIKDVEIKYDNLSIIYTDSQDLNVCDLSQVQSFFKSHAIDYCINCAAYTAVDKAETERDIAFKINAEGAKNLALACKESSVVLIHISTDFVFDGRKKEPYLETDTPNPLSVYGASKLQGEIETQNILKEHFIIRTSWLYSEHGHNFMKTMLKLAETRDKINVVSDQIGTPTYAGDLAKIILKTIASKNTNYGLYHFTNGGEINWYGFAKAIFELSGKQVKLHPIATEGYPTAAKRPRYSVLDKEKIKTAFNIVEIPNWNDSLKKVLKKWMKN
ncbi:dTDP-4-dehydrorhamnose reductase [Flavobacteriaceae bacterium XHP0103]|nr:dTDP-4-dehydrorhamnose reductase [Marixanthotalea marina]